MKLSGPHTENTKLLGLPTKTHFGHQTPLLSCKSTVQLQAEHRWYAIVQQQEAGGLLTWGTTLRDNIQAREVVPRRGMVFLLLLHLQYDKC